MAEDLCSGESTSCGCFHRDKVTKHGLSKTRTYRAWRNMMDRCYNPRVEAYPHYGGREPPEAPITVCERYHVLENFFSDMGEAPPGKSLDRIDNNGNYEPGNLQWAPASVQNGNKRRRKRRRSS